MKVGALNSVAAATLFAGFVQGNVYEGNEVAAWDTLVFDTMGNITTLNGNDEVVPDFTVCRGAVSDPCKCAEKLSDFVCTGEDGGVREIVDFVFEDNGFATGDRLFPAEEVEAFIQALPSLETVHIKGDTAGLGGAEQGCVRVPSCENIDCDFTPREICSFDTLSPTMTPTSSPTTLDIGEEEPTRPPTSTPTQSPTQTPTSSPTIDQAVAWAEFVDACGFVRFAQNPDNPDWLTCRGVRDTPCKCADKEGFDVEVSCSEFDPDVPESGTITAIEFGDNGFTTESGTFPEDAVNKLLGIGTITTFRLSGNVAGLGDETQGCVTVPLCYDEDITCDFSPRVLCAQPTAAPTLSPTMSPTEAPTVTPDDDATNAPSASPTMSPISQDELWTMFFDDFDFVVAGICDDARSSPCDCTTNSTNGVTCDVNGTITSVFFNNSAFENNGTFPSETVDYILGLTSISEISILGDVDGLGGPEQGCLEITNCLAEDVVCDFTPREVCPAPTEPAEETEEPTEEPEETDGPTVNRETEEPTTGVAGRPFVDGSVFVALALLLASAGL